MTRKNGYFEVWKDGKHLAVAIGDFKVSVNEEDEGIKVIHKTGYPQTSNHPENPVELISDGSSVLSGWGKVMVHPEDHGGIEVYRPE